MKQPSLFTDEELGLHIGEERDGYKLVKNSKGCIQRISVKGRKTTAQFIAEAQAIWGDDYDYSETVYVNAKSPVTIFCKKHQHYFTVSMAQNHVKAPTKTFFPTGCELCAEERVGYKTARGPRHYRTPEEIKRDEEAKAQRKAERERRRLENTEERKRQSQEEAERKRREYMEKWHGKTMKEAQFLERLYNKYGDRYDTSLVDYQDRDIEVTLICPDHGPFKIKSRYLLGYGSKRNAHGCWKCYDIPDPHDKPAPMTSDEFFAKMHELYGDRFDFSKSEFNGMGKLITFICNKHGEQRANPKVLLEGKGCKYCDGKFYPPDWIKMAQAVHGNKYQYVGEPPCIGNDMIHYICPKHGLQEQRFDVHVRQGCECPYCKNYTRLSLEERKEKWITKVHKKFGTSRFDFSEVEYVNNDTPVWVTCNIHHHRYQTTPDTLLRGGGGCPYCVASEGEAIIYGWLENHGVNFQHNEVQVPNDNILLPLLYLVPDFWLPDHNMFIEFNGDQHYENIDHFFKGKKVRTFDVQQLRDQQLRQYCHDNKIKLLEIPYEDIKKIPLILSKHVKMRKKK